MTLFFSMIASLADQVRHIFGHKMTECPNQACDVIKPSDDNCCLTCFSYESLARR